MSFDLSIAKLVLSASDASHTFDIGEDPEDVLNEVGGEIFRALYTYSVQAAD